MSGTKHKLPEGWAISTLSELVGSDGVITDGDWVESKDQNINGNVRLIQLADIGDGFYRNRSCRHLTYEKALELKCTFLKKGDVLIARMPDPLGRACIFPGDDMKSVTVVDVCIFRSGNSGINHNYVMYIINSLSIRSCIESLQRGTTRKRISRKNLISIELPITPLAEQERISYVIKKLFVRVNKAKERLDTVTETMKRLRKSVLNAACTGKLTEDWRAKNSISEIESKELLSEEFPGMWNIVKIRDFTSKVGSGATPRGGQKSYKPTGIPLIRSMNIYIEGFRKKGLAFIDEKQASALDNAKVKAKDVLLNITGASIGRVNMAPEEMDGARVNQHVCILRPVKMVMPEFLYMFLASPIMQEFIMQAQYGATRQALTKGQILDFDIPSPSDKEQKEIIRIVDKLFKLADKIERRIAKARERVEKLTQSILAKAFRGELVPTEAELARLEGREYEMAEQLLIRIKKEKEKPKVQKKKVKKTLRGSIIQPVSVHGVVNVEIKSKPLFEIISVRGEISPEDLLISSKYSVDTIEDFYEELAQLEKEGKIEDYRPNNRLSILRIKKT